MNSLPSKELMEHSPSMKFVLEMSTSGMASLNTSVGWSSLSPTHLLRSSSLPMWKNMLPTRKPSTSMSNLIKKLKCMTKTHCCSIVKLGTNDALTDPYSEEVADAERSVRLFIVIVQI